MGLWGRLFGREAVSSVGETARDVIEIFRPNATELSKMNHETRVAVLEQFSGEFAHSGAGWFDQFVNGLNRLPRPCLALGTLGLFVYAMTDPAAFADRMKGLAYVPDPLWWLLGAVVSFYFGARELHYVRRKARAKALSALAQPKHPTTATEESFSEGQ